MKPIYSYALLAALAAVSPALAVDATTTPVGYVTTPIAGNTVAAGAGAFTYISTPFVAPSTYAGASTSSPSGGSVIALPTGVPTDLDGTYVLEIGSSGWWTTVVSSTATSITVSDAFPTGLPANVNVTVRKFNTVGSLFGDNSSGFTGYTGENEDFDQIQLLDPATQETKTVVYIAGVDGVPNGWYDFVTVEPADSTIIYPGSSVKVVRKNGSPLSLTVSGEVKVTPTQVDVFPRDNWLGQPLAGGGTLGSMNFKDQLIRYDGENPNDYLVTLDADQNATVYIAVGPVIYPDAPDGMVLDFVTGAESLSIPISAAAGYVVSRDPASSSSTFTIPAQSVAP